SKKLPTNRESSERRLDMNRGGLREDNVEVGQAYVGEPWLHPRQRAFGEAAPGKDLEGSEIQEKSPDFGKNELRCDSDADESDADDGGEEEFKEQAQTYEVLSNVVLLSGLMMTKL
ncbi:hypothetical protein HID58_002815, partial [Brassica napus]